MAPAIGSFGWSLRALLDDAYPLGDVTLWIIALPPRRIDHMSKPTKIDIWSDVQCGWCFIGKRRLEAAIEGFDGEVEIEYHSFELAPGAPAEFDGATKEFLHHYRGAPFAETERMLAEVTAIAAV